MPLTIVAGGQFGSEGKGKVSLHLARTMPDVAAVVRVGGPNSGHTGVSLDGRAIALRQLPAGAIDGMHRVIIPAGAYVDVDVLMCEIDELGYDRSLITISPLAQVVTDAHRAWERANGLRAAIGSTGSGTGAAVLTRVARGAPSLPPAVQAEEVGTLAPMIGDTTALLRGILDGGDRVVVEGTQGFGLSSLHAPAWPKATSRDTTAAGFLSETGLSPLDVDDVVLVLRCHPIRVAGEQSGPLPNETSWAEIAARAGLNRDLTEHTTVTKLVRRVGDFDAGIARLAVAANRPTRVVLNHLDYVDPQVANGIVTSKARQFVDAVEDALERRIDFVGTSSATVIDYQAVVAAG